MRFMMFMVLPKPHASENGAMPDVETVGRMMKFNEELAKAGMLLALDGLHPTSKGTRVSYPGGKPHVLDGPFPEAKEVIGGYWIIQAKSREEAVEWAKRVPAGPGEYVEVRQVFDMADFPEDVQKVASDLPAVQEAVKNSAHRSGGQR
jgi:hypothetical protein